MRTNIESALLSLDNEALEVAERYYQNVMKFCLYSLDKPYGEDCARIVSKIKYSHDFVRWLLEKIEQAQKGEFHNGRRDYSED